MADIHRLVPDLYDLLRELPNPFDVPADLPNKPRSTALGRLKKAIPRLEVDLVSATGELAAALPELDGLIATLKTAKRQQFRNSPDKSVRKRADLAVKLNPVLHPEAESDPATSHVAPLGLHALTCGSRSRSPEPRIANTP